MSLRPPSSARPRPHLARRTGRLFGLCGLLGALSACESPTQPPHETFDAYGALPFVDQGFTRDGLVVLEDANAPLRDADLFTEAGLCLPGGLVGTACSPSGQPLPQVEVTVAGRDCRGQAVTLQTHSDARGRFVFQGLAPGPAEVNLRAGRFFSRTQAVVESDRLSPVNGSNEKLCLPSSETGLLVLTGDYDRLEDLLEGLGFEHDTSCGEIADFHQARRILSDPQALARYRIVFINCASGIDLNQLNSETQRIALNLSDFVAQGGSLYVSDLSAGFVHTLWPGMIEFDARFRAPTHADTCCVCTENCPSHCGLEGPGEPAPRTCHSPPEPVSCTTGSGTSGHGQSGQRWAQIVSPDLATWLGQERLELNFNLGGWVQMKAVQPSVEVLVRDEQSGQPLMVIFEPHRGGGKVAYTSFHNHAQASDAMRRILEALIFRL